MNDYMLIELVRQNNCLYDFSDKSYSANATRDRIWEEIGDKLNVDGAKARTRWCNIRDTYRKTLIKRQSGDPSKYVKKYKFADHLHFLTFNNSESLAIKEEIDEDFISNSLSISVEEPPDEVYGNSFFFSEQTSSTSESSTPLAKRTKFSAAVNPSQEVSGIRLAALIKENGEMGIAYDESFFCYLLQKYRTLSEGSKRDFRREVNRILLNCEENDDH